MVFIHGLWLLPSSWDRWATVFEEAGFTALTPGWPDDPETVEEANAHPEVFAGKTVGQVADHYDEIIRTLDRKPAVIGHSFGGLLTQILAGRGLAKVSVAIDPAPFRGVLPLPISALKAGSPVLRQPGQPQPRRPAHLRPVPLSGSRTPSARTRPRSCTRPTRSPPPARRCSRPRPPTSTRGRRPRSTRKNPERGPLLILNGEKDHTSRGRSPTRPTRSRSSNEGVTEIVEVPDRGHALTIDSGWREVADKALEFVKRFA